MSRAYEIRLRVTRGEYERFIREAHAQGFKTFASYFRSRIFSQTFIIEQKIVEGHKILKRLEEKFLTKNTYTTTTSPENIQESQPKA